MIPDECLEYGDVKVEEGGGGIRLYTSRCNWLSLPADNKRFADAWYQGKVLIVECVPDWPGGPSQRRVYTGPNSGDYEILTD